MFGLPGTVATLILLVGSRLAGVRIGIPLMLAITSCLIVGMLRQSSEDSVGSLEGLDGSDRAAGEIVSIPVARSNGDRAIIDVDRVRVGNVWIDVDARIVAYLPDNASVTIGDGVEVVWSYAPLETLPPGFAGYVSGQDAIGSASVWSVQIRQASSSPRRYLVSMRRSVSERIQALVPGDTGALMSGIVTGDDSALSTEAQEAFRRTGTGHITAVSGSNVAMLLALWSRILRSPTRRHHLLIQAAVIGLIWSYCIGTGLEASALRATTVATMVVLSGRFGRRSDPLSALALATAVLLLIDPDLRSSLGFWLSVSASAALAGSFGAIQDDSLQSNLLNSARGLVAAQFATLPIIVWAFGTISVTGLIANTMISPVLIMAFPASFLFALLSFVPVVGPVVAVVPALLCDLVLLIVERLSPIAPPISMGSTGLVGAMIIAIPCLLIVLWLNQDVQRWIPRWSVMAQTDRRRVVAGVSGASIGVVTAGLIVGIWF